MFEFNSLVVLSDKKDKQYMVTLKEVQGFPLNMAILNITILLLLMKAILLKVH